MPFAERLHQYLRQLDCTAKELSDASRLSKSIVSRYLSGKRVPAADGKSLQKLAHGIALLSQRRPESALSEEPVAEELRRTLSGIEIDYDSFCANLSLLLKALSVNYNDLSKSLNFDPSYISRILSGQRRPGNLPKFFSGVSQYVARRYGDEAHAPIIAELTGCAPEEAADPILCAQIISRFLDSNAAQEESPVKGFLTKMDTFDLNAYIRSIRFDEIKAPTAPFRFPHAKIYHGLKEMMECELDFLKLTVLSKSKGDMFIYSEMPLEQMSKDPDFPKKWLYGVALVLKKGFRLNIVHDVDRPFGEMLLGLEGWIPMYMTGQISPYYFKHKQSDVFLHHLKTSGAAALYGEAIAGHHAEGRYYLSNSREDVRYYQNEARLMLQKALPLMQIYTGNRQQDFARNMTALMQSRSRRMIYSSLPIFTLSQETLEETLERHQVPAADAKRILDYGTGSKHGVSRLLEQNRITLEIPHLTEAEFEQHPVSLSLSELFYPTDLVYTYGEYLTHLEQTKQFAETHPNCTLRLNTSPAFRNINITVIEGKAVVVSKSKSPTIHFVIEHPKMLYAFEHFMPAVEG